MFDDDRYYEFMFFDEPKVVRSPIFDHGHKEESQNGRDVKIDILYDYIRTSERFRVIQVFFGVSESYENTGKKYWASWAKWWKRVLGIVAEIKIFLRITNINLWRD